MSKKIIILDFGHGGIDDNNKYTTAPNKMHKFDDGVIAYEGHLNRQIGMHLYTYLKNDLSKKIYTTTLLDSAHDYSLKSRVDFANRFNKDDSIFISIHCNASKDHKASGFEVFTTINKTESDNIATYIINSMERLYSIYEIKLRSDESDLDKDKEENFYVLKNTIMPAVLIECGFFDNKKDYVFLANPKYQATIAWYIYQGIENYLKNEKR